MDIIIEYLIEKGGIFGVLLAIALAWIAFREQNFYKNQNSDKSKDKKDESENNIEKILLAVENLKTSQKELTDQARELSPLINQIHKLDQDIEKKIRDLWEWHSVFDDEGVPIWYVRKSLGESIENLEITVDLLQEKFLQANETLRTDLMSRLQKINDERVVELKELLENYNKTVTDLIIALEKIKFLLKSEKGE